MKGLRIEAGAFVEVDLGKLYLSRPAKMVWTKQVSRPVLSAGLKFLQK